MSAKAKKVVLAYSGGLDTSVIIPWLKENYGAEVIAFAADIGQGAELDGLEEKAIRTGASKCIIEDLREEFACEFVLPCLRAGAVYERKYLLGTSFARPLIARRQVEIAEAEGADAVSHGCTGKGNDQVRFELAFKALNPRLKIIAPWREWDLKSREDEIDYALARKIPITATKEKIYSEDRNLWHISHEGGILEDPWVEPEESMFVLTVSPDKAPDRPRYVEIEFESGNPVAVDGRRLSPVEVISLLNQVGGAHGVGRADLVENRLVGMKSRGVYETPGGTLLLAAHRELESLTLDKATLHYKDLVAAKYAELVYNGEWFAPLRYAMDAFIDSIQARVTGTVRLKLYKGNIIVAGRKSPNSLYREDLATFAEDAVYNQKDAEGFINLFGLPYKVEALLDTKAVYRERRYRR
ncbi:MAG: argininosuccinate synthase [Acidobacteriota bacterium]|jgi:argininosuccinate synthase|nr:argininosuccinate synthase [Acidobacteriota bacterium]NLT32758.1 argininosuccinate synthase [Acidobacteriota bacterium]